MVSSQYFKSNHSRNLRLNNLHLGDEAELVFDLQEDGVESQLVGLLVESGQSRSGLCQQAGVTCALLLWDKEKEMHKNKTLNPQWTSAKSILILTQCHTPYLQGVEDLHQAVVFSHVSSLKVVVFLPGILGSALPFCRAGLLDACQAAWAVRLRQVLPRRAQDPLGKRLIVFRGRVQFLKIWHGAFVDSVPYELYHFHRDERFEAKGHN